MGFGLFSMLREKESVQAGIDPVRFAEKVSGKSVLETIKARMELTDLISQPGMDATFEDRRRIQKLDEKIDKTLVRTVKFLSDEHRMECYREALGMPRPVAEKEPVEEREPSVGTDDGNVLKFPDSAKKLDNEPPRAA